VPQFNGIQDLITSIREAQPHPVEHTTTPLTFTKMARYGPQAPPDLGAAPNEHLPVTEAAILLGHEGAVLAVRFNTQGTYCMSCGKVR
jgi:hypothetical protein